MNRRRFIQGIGASATLCTVLLSLTPPVWAQGAQWGGTSALHESTSRNAAVEAAKKEVAAYKAAFAIMEKEKGWAAASRFFLTPDYKETALNGVIHTKEAHIRRWADTYARINKERVVLHIVSEPAQTRLPQRDFYEAVEVTAQENAVVVTTRVLVPEVRSTLALPLYGAGRSLNALPQYTQKLNTVRKVFRRTVNGLRLAQEIVTTSPFGIYDKMAVSDARGGIHREP